MALTNRERVERALEALRDGLAPFVEREVQEHIRQGKIDMNVVRRFATDPMIGDKPITEWDVAGLLKLMWEAWNSVFRDTLGHSERSLVSELRDWRNRWAHQEPFSSDDTDRMLDSAERLLAAVSAPQADRLSQMKRELRRLVYEEQVRGEKRKAGGSLIEAAAAGALPPWREVITPHPDVASGLYRQAEFAADLWQVHLGQAASEYQDPVEFFRRTYLTESLKQLLTMALRRLAGKGGDPVVQLQTNFGGGKTHSMLALYHLFGEVEPHRLEGIEPLLAAAEVDWPGRCRRVVLVGNKISPGNPVTKPDGTVVRTLWGELAYQLGGKEAFSRIARDDEAATSPGDALRELLSQYGPCLILIDEWVAYARQLHDERDLPGGSFETQFSFAQVLTESARATRNCLLVISLPASDTMGSPHAQADDAEVGGLRGREALERLRNVVGRMESSWRPASSEEGFEIVRRRLFEPLSGAEAFKKRDIVARAFGDYYRGRPGEFPPECRERAYEERIKMAYPIHPEVFDQLYGTWSALAKFQRTRGVLRLMASVIHKLWERGDKNPLIMPASIPMDDLRVQAELTRYLSDNWAPIIESEVDGPNAIPAKIDAEQPNLGRLSAARRVARAVYLGSAPKYQGPHPGIEDRRVILGCAMPGEPTAPFGDALRRLAARTNYLHNDGNTYWYSTQPTITKLADDRAQQFLRDHDRIIEHIERRVKSAIRERGPFARVHAFPQGPEDVSDDPEARLVVLKTSAYHMRGTESPAIKAAREILESPGRRYRNALVFLAADRTRLQDLDNAMARYLAWESICDEKEKLNLDPAQARQAETGRHNADEIVAELIPEVFKWVLYPMQSDPRQPVTMEAESARGSKPLASRAAELLFRKSQLSESLGYPVLRHLLDKVPLWEGDSVPVEKLLEYFPTYNYLERLTDPEVILDTIVEGVKQLTWRQESFAWAARYDEQQGRLVELVAGKILDRSRVRKGILVKADAAAEQLEAEKEKAPTQATEERSKEEIAGSGERIVTVEPPTQAPQPFRRFYGSVKLNTLRLGSEAAKLNDEVISHLQGLVGADVKVTLEIEAFVAGGIPEDVVRIVRENCGALKFESFEFEKE